MIKRSIGGAVLLAGLATALWYVWPQLIPDTDVTQRPAQSVIPDTTPPPVSYVSISVPVAIDRLRKLISEQLTEEALIKNAKIPNRKVTITVERREPLAIWFKNDTMHLRLPIKFWIRGDFKTKGKMTIRSRAKFGVTEEWQPKVDVNTGFEWDWQPRVGVWPFRVRIGDRLGPYIQKALDQGGEELSRQAGGTVNLRELAEAGWNRLHEPRQLKDDPPAWLSVEPLEVFLDPITSDEQDIHITTWLKSHVMISEGTQPAAFPPKPLPPLVQHSPEDKKYAVRYSVNLAYSDIEARLRSELLGDPLRLEQGEITPTDIKVYPAGEQVAIALSFSGHGPHWWQRSGGTVYFTGRPVYDAETSSVHLEDLKATDKKGQPFARLAGWAVQDYLRDLLGRRMLWDVSVKIAQARTDMNSYMNRTLKGYDLWGSVDRFDVKMARPEADGIGVIIEAGGELALFFLP